MATNTTANQAVGAAANAASNVPIVGGLVSSGIKRLFGYKEPPRTTFIGSTGFSAGGITPNPPNPVFAAVQVRPETRPSPQPIPDPVPKRPYDELAGDPKLVPGTKLLEQNPERYGDKGPVWQIQAEPQITPLELVKGIRPELKPVLWADGVVVKVGDEYLCSKRTLADILNSGNPHYDVAVNGTVLNTPMGKSIPIIQLDISKLKEIGDQRDRVNRYAGVKSVDYVNESAPVDGTNIPRGLLDQINWTLVESLERFPDRFEVYDILAALQGDYSIAVLRTSTAQEENKLDKAKLEAFLQGMDQRLKLMRKDFNTVKRLFYNGEPPTGAIPVLTYTKVAKTVNPEDEESRNPVVIKETETVATQATPATTGGEDPIAKLKEELLSGEFKLPGAGGSLKDFRTRPNQPDQRQSLIAKWQAYKWSEKDAEYLKAVSIKEVEKPPTVVSQTMNDPNDKSYNPKKIVRYYGVKNPDTGVITGIRYVQWNPEMLVKGRIVDPLPAKWANNPKFASPMITAKEEENLIALFGKPPGYDEQRRTKSGVAKNERDDTKNEYWWISQNNKRQAEIIQLAYQIHKIELETGKKIPAVQPPGVSLGGKSVTSFNVGVRPGGEKP